MLLSNEAEKGSEILFFKQDKYCNMPKLSAYFGNSHSS